MNHSSWATSTIVQQRHFIEKKELQLRIDVHITQRIGVQSQGVIFIRLCRVLDKEIRRMKMRLTLFSAGIVSDHDLHHSIRRRSKSHLIVHLSVARQLLIGIGSEDRQFLSSRTKERPLHNTPDPRTSFLSGEKVNQGENTDQTTESTDRRGIRAMMNTLLADLSMAETFGHFDRHLSLHLLTMSRVFSE